MQKHWPLVLGIGVPALFLLIVLGVALLPRSGEGPSHDILFSGSENGYRYYGEDYIDTVENGKLVRRPNEAALSEWHNGSDPSVPGYSVRREPDPARAAIFYRYDVEDGSMKKISFEEASALDLDAGPTSDDGFSVGSLGYYGGDGIFEIFGSSRSRAARIPVYRDGRTVYEITLPTDSYYGSPTFLAWIQ